MFLGALAEHLDRLIIAGKVDPRPGKLRYEIAEPVDFVELPYFESLTRPARALVAMTGSLRAFWRVLGEVDTVWLLGPHPLALAFAALAFSRGRRVVLGVRQDFPRYLRVRHPKRHWVHLSGALLDGAWRALARVMPLVAVGPALAAQYPGARTLELVVSLVREGDLASGDPASRSYDGEIHLLSVGRLEEEKNPLLLAEVLSLLRARSPRWRLRVCGEGPLEKALGQRLADLGLAEHVDLLGYVPHDAGLAELYLRSHVLLHVSWTEGLPQVLYEAFAARLPVVATDVGGIRAAAADAALLAPPGDAPAAAAALERIVADEALRRDLVASGWRRVSAHTLEAEARRLAAFFEQGSRR